MDGRKDIRSDASIVLYVEVSESTEFVLECVVESNERSLSSAVRKDTDDWTIGDLYSRQGRQFVVVTTLRMALPGRQLLFARCGIHTRSTHKFRICLEPLLHGLDPRFHKFVVFKISLWIHHHHRWVVERVLIHFQDPEILELSDVCRENSDLVLRQRENLQGG